MKKLTIKSWSLQDRPREKLLDKGSGLLSDAELLAILIGSGSPQESAVSLSQRILNTVDNNLNELSKLPIEKLLQFKGIGTAKAISIVTALELGKRRQYEPTVLRVKIQSSKDVFTLMQPLIGQLAHEEFWVLFLNNSNTILGRYQISKGGITSTVVDIRLLCKKALDLMAVGIILCHNHPSENVQPSAADISLTQKIKNAAQTLDIKLLDHLIVSQSTYFSFADEAIL